MHIHNRLGMIEGVETMLAQERRLDQVANNLANVDTAGYKKDSVTFWEMLYQANAERQRVGKALNVRTDHQQGHVDPTGNPLDLAINGEGFFRLQTDQGIRYTRAGSFELDALGQLRTPEGGLLLGEGGPIVVDNENFAVERDGRVMVDGVQVNQLEVVGVNDLTNLVKEGRNHFRLAEGGAEAALEAMDFQVRQGFLEKSNVNSMEEMTIMIDLQRSYEAQQKMVQAVDDMDDQAISRVGRFNR